jgi:hypothetical protein
MTRPGLDARSNGAPAIVCYRIRTPVKYLRALVPSLVAFAGLAAAACGSSSTAPSNDDANVEKAIVATCTATMAPSCDDASTPDYAQVTPILEKSCVPCHPGPAGAPQWPLTAYTDIQPWAGVILDEVCGNTMPPLDGGIPITASDRLTLLDWAQCGAPQ